MTATGGGASAAPSRTTLLTPRLALRPFTGDDAPAHLRLYGDPEVTRHLGGGTPPPHRVAERSRRTLDTFVAHWAEHGWGVWAVVHRGSGEVIGQCGLQHLPETPEVEVLWAIERRWWGHGLASEAARAALSHGFRALDLPRIVAVTRPDNRRSRAMMERLGMICEGECVVHGIAAVRYALSRESFRAGTVPT